MANKFESFPIFTEAHSLVLLIYRLSKKFPTDEKYGLTSQIKRSSASIPSNIIEGNSRGHKKIYLEFLYIAKGSLEETKYHLLLARDLGYINREDYDLAIDISENVGRQLSGLIQYLKKPILKT
jgi:four helix bundle protein